MFSIITPCSDVAQYKKVTTEFVTKRLTNHENKKYLNLVHLIKRSVKLLICSFQIYTAIFALHNV